MCMMCEIRPLLAAVHHDLASRHRQTVRQRRQAGLDGKEILFLKRLHRKTWYSTPIMLNSRIVSKPPVSLDA